MSVQPTVSIICPVYNAGKHLRACIKSILGQTYANLDIIFVNDGSTDGSNSILHHFSVKDQRITLLNQRNRGPGFSRNRGLAYARGDFVQFVDADDVLHSEMTATLMNAKEADTDMVICGFRYGKKAIHPHVTGTLPRDVFLQDFGAFYQTMLFPSPCNKLYRLSVLRKHAIQFPRQLLFGEDVLFNLSCLEHTRKMTVIPDILYMYQENKASLTHAYIENMYRTHEAIFQHIRDFLILHKAWDGKNRAILSMLFAEGTIQAAANIFHRDNQIDQHEKYRQLEQLLSETTVKAHLPAFKGSKQARFVRFLAERKAYHMACRYFQLKRTIQKLPFFTKLLQRFNRRLS